MIRRLKKNTVVERLSAVCTGLLLIGVAAMTMSAHAVVLDAHTRAIPGRDAPTPYLQYRDPAATNILIAGTWDQWREKYPLQRTENGIWRMDVRTLPLPAAGRYAYKFIVNEQWEEGNNRVFFLNPHHLLEPLPHVMHTALMETTNRIRVTFLKPAREVTNVTVMIDPDVPVRAIRMPDQSPQEAARGYYIQNGRIVFYLDEKVYGLSLSKGDRVNVAGSFNDWNAHHDRWRLQDKQDDGLWTLTRQIDMLHLPEGQTAPFKFVINGGRWLEPPVSAPNAAPDGKGHTNLQVDPQQSGNPGMLIQTAEPLALTSNYYVVIDGLWSYPLRKMVDPTPVLDRLRSDKPLGVQLDRARHCTVYRVFAPRAHRIQLEFYEDYRYEIPHEDPLKDPVKIQPVEQYPLWKDPADGVWEITLRGLDIGRYYSFRVYGPEGDGEGFNPRASTGDPYARAAAHAEHNTMVIDPKATNQWFNGWTDQSFTGRPPQDVVIYETHVRHLTRHPSSKVPERLRGSYAGLLATEGLGTGLDHLRELGVNTIEFLPLAEFNNGVDRHDWGYTTAYYFAPEASYAQAPLQGSQYYELKHLVNELHRQGFAVVMDVVYNHVGWPNVFSMLDRKYYFRLNPDWTYSNYSACGNDVRTEAPMMRRLIVDNILYWMEEFHIDGFRFDLAELIDMETMFEIRDKARKLNPNVLLISEPWSHRGWDKKRLTGTEWSAWNNDFRYAVKDFVQGHHKRDQLKKTIFGSLENWAADPLQPVNYAESHDDMALVDEISLDPGKDGSNPTPDDAARNRLTATVLFTSLGIPMIAEGQEFLRSKFGIENTFSEGDRVNALRWDDRDRPPARDTLDYYAGLIHLRTSRQGAAFRLADKPSPGYYRWIMPQNPHALGYVVNDPQQHAGASFIVLLNADDAPVDFSVPFPGGQWRLVGNGDRIMAEGFPGEEIQGSVTKNIQVPRLSSRIFMREEKKHERI